MSSELFLVLVSSRTRRISAASATTPALAHYSGFEMPAPAKAAEYLLWALSERTFYLRR